MQGPKATRGRDSVVLYEREKRKETLFCIRPQIRIAWGKATHDEQIITI